MIACGLLGSDPAVPPAVCRFVEELATRRVPAGPPGAYNVKPREFNRVREHLAGLLYRDAARPRGASEVLALISVSRLEDGIRPNEPRRPDIGLLTEQSTAWELLP